MTSNIQGSLICSPKSLYKKTSHQILGRFKAAFKTGASKVPRPWPILPSLLQPICQACVNSQLSPSPPRGREKKNVTKMDFSNCNDHSLTAIFSSRTFEFEYFFLCGLLSSKQHVGPMLHSFSPSDNFVNISPKNQWNHFTLALLWGTLEFLFVPHSEIFLDYQLLILPQPLRLEKYHLLLVEP